MKLGFAGLFVVDPVGLSGGSCFNLLWQEEHSLEIYNYSRRHINVVIKHGVDQFWWKLIGFYGHPDNDKREESWSLLRHLNIHEPTPWLCIGDFNEILALSEKEGAAVHQESLMVGFRTALEDCQLGDLGFMGSKFTWGNRRSDATFTKERLDRAVANIDWCHRYPVVKVTVLAGRTSDHSPLYMEYSEQPQERHSYKRSFKFEDSWHTDLECKEVIKLAWESDILGGASMDDVQRRLTACQLELSRWSWRKFGNSQQQLKLKTKQLEALQRRECPAIASDISTLHSEIDGILEREDIK